MLIVYGACGENAYAAVEAYAARFPANVFLRLVNRARNTGKYSGPAKFIRIFKNVNVSCSLATSRIT
jgi:hypothetical protein